MLADIAGMLYRGNGRYNHRQHTGERTRQDSQSEQCRAIGIARGLLGQ